MTSSLDDPSIITTAAEMARLDSSGYTTLHHHATSVWLLPAAGLVARIDRSADRVERALRSVRLTRWLSEHDVPVTEPAAVDQPVLVDGEVGVAVTFWRYYRQPDGVGLPGAAHLGSILRRLHQLPAPPVELPPYRPLQHLGQALAVCTALPESDRSWLAEQREEMLARYTDLDSELGVGMIHGDAYPGNTLWDTSIRVNDSPGLARLGDWDEAAIGPRELDLANTHQGARLGRSQQERDAFTRAYGWDLTAWPGFATLRAMRDLHTLGAFIDRAERGDRAALQELQYRVATLRAGDTTARWNTGAAPKAP